MPLIAFEEHVLPSDLLDEVLPTPMASEVLAATGGRRRAATAGHDDADRDKIAYRNAQQLFRL